MLVKNTMVIALGNLATKFVGFFLLPLYTALLSTQEYGTVDLISVYAMFLTVALSAQFELGLFRYLVETRGNPNGQKRYISTAFITIGVVNISFLAVVLPVMTFLLKYPYTQFLLYGALTHVLSAMLLQAARGLGDNVAYSIGSCVNGSLNIILNVLFIVVLHWNVQGMLLASIIAPLVSSAFLFCRLKMWRYISRKAFGRTELSHLAQYSMPLIPYTLCWWLISVSDRVIVSHILGISQNGIYSVANKFSTAFVLVTNIFQTSWVESASETIGDQNRDRYYQSVLTKSIKLFSACSIALIAGLPLAFRYLVNDHFSAAYEYIPVLLTAALLQSVSSLFGSVYFAFKKTKKASTTNILAAALNIFINLLFIRLIGLYAAALSTFVAYFVAVLIRYHDMRETIHLRIDGKYLLLELLAYAAVIAGYYLNHPVLSGIIFLFSLLYCYLRNRNTFFGLYAMLQRKLRGKKELNAT